MSSPACRLQDFPVPPDLAPEHPTGSSFPGDLQPPGNSDGASAPSNHAPTAASGYANTDRPCRSHVATTVQVRSHQRFPASLRVPCVISRSITTNRIACSARLFVGSNPVAPQGTVVMLGPAQEPEVASVDDLAVWAGPSVAGGLVGSATRAS